MESLLDMCRGLDDPIRPFGDVDVLLYYGAIAPYLLGYLRGRELASRIWLPGTGRKLLKRGSKDAPLFIEDMAEAVTPGLVEARHKIKELKEARTLITGKQAAVWEYFVPRKLADFFYATNGEGEGREISRVFFDVDRGDGTTAADALQVARLLIEEIRSDESISEHVKGEPYISWTGFSFHVLLELKRPQPARFFDECLRVSAVKALDTPASAWVEGVKKRAKVPVVGGHVKAKGAISIDPSQTPSGKLCRVPLGSLHMRDARTVNGVSLPLAPDMLEESAAEDLESYTPGKVLDHLPELAKRLPQPNH
jgi:hypothetical protein